MTSRVGPQAAGTDGSDFKQREKVAPQYQMRQSYLVCALVCLSVTISKLDLVPSDTAAEPYKWEYPYLISCFPLVTSSLSLSKHNISYLVISMISSGLFSIALLFYGLYCQGKAYHFIFGWAEVTVMYLVIVVAVQGDACQIYYSNKLLDTWFDFTQEKKKK
uniref:Jagunal homolog 1a n=1 Tax=Hucho hucho TaxID=62062 RepID=A0A4W5Q5P7_9TELE